LTRQNGSKAVSMEGDQSLDEKDEKRKRVAYTENRDRVSFATWADIYGYCLV
jgi:hypothetical protein